MGFASQLNRLLAWKIRKKENDMTGSGVAVQLKNLHGFEHAVASPEHGQVAKANRFLGICIGAGSYCFVTRFNL